MSAKAKKFSNLSKRQKQKRIAVIHSRLRITRPVSPIPENSEDSSSDDGSLIVRALEQAPLDYNDDSFTDDDVEMEELEGEFLGEERERRECEPDNAANIDGVEEEEEIVPNVNDDVGVINEENRIVNVEENEILNLPIDVGEEAQRKLKNTFLNAKLNYSQQNQILETLRRAPFFLHYLPKDSRTLQNTPTIVVRNIIQNFEGGDYLHLGFEEHLTKRLMSLPENLLPEFILVDISTDGGQLFRSGRLQYWPIQFRIVNIRHLKPMIAGVFCGESKPLNVFEFFQHLIAEIQSIWDNDGITIRNLQLSLRIRCFIADAPARAFALNHKGHASAHPCSKCKVVGHRCTTPGFESTMVFPGIGHERRTDDEYRAMLDEDHHKGPSPLSPVTGLVSRVPFEAMHLVYLGVEKRKLEALVLGKFGRRRLNVRKVNILDSRIALLQQFCPSDFNRKLGPLSYFNQYKATQYRQLLLYAAPAVFRDVIDQNCYQHMMLLHCIIRFLSFENQYAEILDFCQAAIESYVTLCEQLYGQQFISYNVHGILHIVDDVRELGPLESFSAFCYENNMPSVRNLSTERPRGPLEQLYKNMKIRCDLTEPVKDVATIIPSGKHVDGPLCGDFNNDNCEQFQIVKIDETILSKFLKDCCCILRNSEICIIMNIIRVHGNVTLIVKQFLEKDSLYNVGYSSEAVGVYLCRRLPNTLFAVPLLELDKKCYLMPKWSSVEGQEELVVANEFICVTFITPIVFPPL